ncbi:hypothetical protein [Burkholderia phage vB_BpP_HN04]
MAITNVSAFGSSKKNAAANKQELKKSQFWINIGYQAEIQTEEGTELRFISLPNGMALDDMEPVKVSGNNEVWLYQQSARNDLLAQLKAKAESLKPGEEVLIGEGPIVIQLRRVSDEAKEIKAAANPLARNLGL